MQECARDHVEPSVAVHIQEVFAVVLQVIRAERQDFAKWALDKFRPLIPELAGGDVRVTVFVDVADRTAFVVVDVQLPHGETDLRRLWLGGFLRLLRQCGERENGSENRSSSQGRDKGFSNSHGIIW
ncbi:MAG: hypothetical protein VCA55_16120 [Verrucomicrobiales bacterium]